MSNGQQVRTNSNPDAGMRFYESAGQKDRTSETPMQAIDEIKLVPDKTKKLLNQRDFVDYEVHREKMTKWLLTQGKNPDHMEGYSLETVKGRI